MSDRPTFWKLGTRVTGQVTRALAPNVRVLRGDLVGAIGGLWRQRGSGGVVGAVWQAVRNNRSAAQLVEGNLYRKAIRFPGVFRGPVLSLYGWLKRTEAVLVEGHLHAHLPEAGHDVAVIFNGSNFPESVLAKVATERGMARVYTEAGFLPGTMQIDGRGLNAANSVPRDPGFYLDPTTDFAASGLPESIGRRETKRQGADATDLPQSYIFVPFQVPSDMQVRVHSPWIRSMEDFLDVVLELARRYPDRQFVIKEHPSFRRSVDRDRVNTDRVVFANNTETRALIEGADAVLTLNSTVGIEALVLGRPVIIAAEACYDIEGLVMRARDADSLSEAIGRIPGWQPDAELRRQFLGYLRNVYLVPGTLARPPEDLSGHILTRARSGDSPTS